MHFCTKFCIISHNKGPKTCTSSGPTKPAYAPGLEADHSLASSANVKNEWSHSSIPPVCLHGVDRENFTLTRSVYFMFV